MGKVATPPLPSRGSPPLQSGGQNQKWPTSGQSGYVTPAVSGIPTASERGAKSEVAHKLAKWLRHPCRLGDPHHFGAGSKSEVAHKWAKWLCHPSRLGDPHRFRAGGENQKWPTCGQSGYVTAAVSGIPTASEQRGKSEVATWWGKWLRHSCRLGHPHRFRAGGVKRSGPQFGKVATSPLPSRGSPPLQSGGQNQKCSTCGQSGYVTPAVSGIPTASERGGKIRNGPLVGKVAMSPLPSRGSPPLQSGGQNQKWPTCGQSGYITPAVSGIPTASERRGKSEVATWWGKWLRHSCRLGHPHRFRAGGVKRSGPQFGKVATSPLPSRGSPPLQSGGQNQKWPTSGESGYATPAISGIPTASQRGAKSEVAHKWAKWLRQPCRLGDPHRFRAGGKIRSGPQVGKVATSPLPSRGSPPLRSGVKIRSGPQMGKVAMSPLPSRGSPPLQSGGGKSEVAHLWAKWLCHRCRLGDPHRFGAEGEIRSGHLVGKVATSLLPSRASPPLQSGGGKEKWPTIWQSGYVTPAVSGIPTASERGAKSEVLHLWAKWLRHPCRLGDPHRFRAGGQNQKWPTCGQSGYVTPAVSGIPTASERGAKSEVAHLWAKWLHHPCRLGNPHRFRAEGEIRSGHLVGKVATSLLPSRASPPLQSGGGKEKWPTIWQSGYVTPAVSGIPTASERGAKSEVAHKWGKWLRHPCHLGDPHRFRAGGKIRSGPQVGKVATSPLPSQGSPPLQSGGQNQKWPTSGKVATSPLPSRGSPPLQSGGGNQKWPASGQSGYVNPALSGIPTASERGAKSEVAHKWAKWLRHPCRLGDPHRPRAGKKITSGPQVGKVATSPLPSRGSPPLQSGGQNQKWPSSGQSGYVTPAISGIPIASERGAKSEVAHLWAKWLRHSCRLGDPERCRAVK